MIPHSSNPPVGSVEGFAVAHLRLPAAGAAAAVGALRRSRTTAKIDRSVLRACACVRACVAASLIDGRYLLRLLGSEARVGGRGHGRNGGGRHRQADVARGL